LQKGANASYATGRFKSPIGCADHCCTDVYSGMLDVNDEGCKLLADPPGLTPDDLCKSKLCNVGQSGPGICGCPYSYTWDAEARICACQYGISADNVCVKPTSVHRQIGKEARCPPNFTLISGGCSVSSSLSSAHVLSTSEPGYTGTFPYQMDSWLCDWSNSPPHSAIYSHAICSPDEVGKTIGLHVVAGGKCSQDNQAVIGGFCRHWTGNGIDQNPIGFLDITSNQFKCRYAEKHGIINSTYAICSDVPTKFVRQSLSAQAGCNQADMGDGSSLSGGGCVYSGTAAIEIASVYPDSEKQSRFRCQSTMNGWSQSQAICIDFKGWQQGN
jgi:hypothetical protein